MLLSVTARIINPDPELLDTLKTANQACQSTIDIGLKSKTFNKAKLHKASYRKIRKAYPSLNSSLVTAVRDQASDMLKRLKLKKRPVKRLTGAVRLNHNTFKPFFDSNIVSISTTSGRRKYNITIPAYALERYAIKTSTAATLREKHRQVLLDIQFDIPEPKVRKANSIVGIDRGLINPAVTSNAHFFNGRKLRKVKGRYAHLRGILQRTGTRSAKRHLKLLRGRERRFVADTNHCISKTIANSDCDAVAFEELNPAAMKMRYRRGKRAKRMSKLGSWSPTQLLRFTEYKLRMLGKACLHVAAHFTSQACNRCGDIRKENRNGRVFKCMVCGYSLHSDLNAARNIASLAKSVAGRLPVNQPKATCDEFKASPRDELRTSIVASSAFSMRT